MAKRQGDPSVSRRKFLSGAAVAGAAVTAQGASPATSFAAPAPNPMEPARLPSALPPSAKVAAAEVGTPNEPPRGAGPAGSDFMVDVIKSLDIEYLPSNPASSFRALHESLINYGGNKKTELLTFTHEESAVGMAHGYFKASRKPLVTLCHGTVGPQHAALAIFNAWWDRVPVLLAGRKD